MLATALGAAWRALLPGAARRFRGTGAGAQRDAREHSLDREQLKDGLGLAMPGDDDAAGSRGVPSLHPLAKRRDAQLPRQDRGCGHGHERAAAVLDEEHEGAEYQEFVGQGVKQSTECGMLVEASGQVAIQPVSYGGDCEKSRGHHGCPGIPGKHNSRHCNQSCHSQHVGDGLPVVPFENAARTGKCPSGDNQAVEPRFMPWMPR
mmetsp:Transcript_25176/g.84006  ORF Transcript_25176/g.84006 Transcript_25176/m.84006 type:complete len:205 (+) Transcript_25176:365-979(+)